VLADVHTVLVDAKPDGDYPCREVFFGHRRVRNG
jgi:hypothetical protein